MAGWTERPVAPGLPDGEPLDARWRERMQRLQQEAMPHGRVAVSCPAPLDSGGLGRHLREILDALARAGGQSICICRPSGGAPRAGEELEIGAGALVHAAAPATRLSRAWRMWAQSADFDLQASRRLPRAEHLIAFNGAAARQLHAAARAPMRSRALVSANSHFRNVVRQHERAYERYPIERPWVRHLLRRNLAEYARAERIYVSSEYVRRSFLDAGHRDTALQYFPLTPHPRFEPAPAAPSSSTFEVVYVGALTVHKGVPLLIDALRALPAPDLRLVLVGGWGTRAMRRYLQRACAADARITISPGDPLARLQSARLCVHPAYEDGFGYAAAEALACGVPVITSEDTGMKELIADRRSGLVLPTGDLSALTQAIGAAYRGELFT